MVRFWRKKNILRFIIKYSNLKSSTNIKNCYDHKLKRNGHNFCRGQIGERKYDLVFIQSIDGAISIYKQDGEIGFINRKDSFVITNIWSWMLWI